MEPSMVPLEKPGENILERELIGTRKWKDREVGTSGDPLPQSIRGWEQWRHDAGLCKGGHTQ